jgi:hypothetical protein
MGEEGRWTEQAKKGGGTQKSVKSNELIKLQREQKKNTKKGSKINELGALGMYVHKRVNVLPLEKKATKEDEMLPRPLPHSHSPDVKKED